MSDKTIIIYAGDIIDGITVDGKLFGDNDGWPTTVNLTSDEYVYGIEFGYHFDHICASTIHTKQRNSCEKTACNPINGRNPFNNKIYGPWATDECSSRQFFKISTTLKQFLNTNSSTSSKGKILINSAMFNLQA